MEDNPLGWLFGLLVVLFALSAFFSGSETALMSLNRYKLKHKAEAGQRGPRLAQTLLNKPERLIGLILIGNNFVNILITQVATYIGYLLYQDKGIAIATGVLTFLMLIFGEVTPKTFGALHSERIAYAASYIYTPLMRVAFPLVWFVNLFSTGLLRLLGVSGQRDESHKLSADELRTVVSEASGLIHDSHHEMLLRILDLEKVTVADVMIPRSEIVGIDLDADANDLEETLRAMPFTRMPVYRGQINNTVGYIHMRHITALMARDRLTAEDIEQQMLPPYFVPESISLTQQLANFRRERRRHALVVDEYGDIIGLVALEDILEEIVGEFEAQGRNYPQEVHPQADGSFIVDASVGLRELNRLLGITLPTDGPRTLNGLIFERLEIIPDAATALLIEGYPVEIIKTADNMVKTARIVPVKRPPRRVEPD
ncbi:MAG: HlyC/CorC family transporter [Thiotrichales bacterium]